MRALSNPMVLQMIGLAMIAIFAVGVAWMLIRHMRRTLIEGGEGKTRTSPEAPEFQLAAYHGVIQRLKEQEQELQRLRQAESQRAAASQNISDAVLSNLSSGVLLFTPVGTVRQANAAARAILGYASPSGLHARDLFRGVSQLRAESGEPAAASLPGILEAALRQDQTFRRLEADYATPTGDRRVLGITLSPVRTPSGEPLGTACLISDLTEVSELARQMRLKQNLAALGEMSAGIAHEIKNSLATISGYAQMLAADNDTATTREFAARVQAETANLTRIVTDFLAFARPQDLRRESVNLRDLLADCSRECAVELSLDEVASDLTVSGDPTALRQAFSNLLRNSAEASRDGRVVRVHVCAEAGGESVRLVLRDDGCGIPQENLSRIFVPFFTTKTQGTGLGLALVHRIVTEHGGSVTVASDPSGTTFTLSLPNQGQAKSAAVPG